MTYMNTVITYKSGNKEEPSFSITVPNELFVGVSNGDRFCFKNEEYWIYDTIWTYNDSLEVMKVEYILEK